MSSHSILDFGFRILDGHPLPPALSIRCLQWLTLLWLTLSTVAPAAEDSRLDGFVKTTGLSGGLCVLVGDGSSELELATDLARSGRYLVQLLVPPTANITELRAKLQSAGLYGLVTADPWVAAPNLRLPYTENLVNALLVAEGAKELKLPEAIRVLAPGGLLLMDEQRTTESVLKAAHLEEPKLVELGRHWWMARKTRTNGMDQWSHPRHAADNNPVSQDTQVAPPRRVRWVTGPQQEISSMITAGGRNFYAGLLVRDAFNGLKLWESTLTPSPARGGFNFTPAPGSVPPVVEENRIFVYSDHKVMALDGATGAVVQEYAEEGEPQEFRVAQGRLLIINKNSLRVVDVSDGRLVWNAEAVNPRCVAVGDGGVYFLEGPATAGAPPSIACYGFTNGKFRWQKNDFDWLPRVRNLVYHNGVLVCELSTFSDSKPEGNLIHALSATEGKWLWKYEFIPGMAHKKQARAMFADDLVWVLESKKCTGLDPKNGQVKKSVPASITHCFPPVATPQYLLAGELNLTDFKTGRTDANRITKAACSRDAGWIPANGLIYTSPKHCICWPMLRDYSALAPARPEGDPMAGFNPSKFKPERGPAAAVGNTPNRPEQDWPCYRHDANRSGSTTATVPNQLQVLWKRSLGDRPQGTVAEDWKGNYFIRGPVGPPVVAAGKVYVTRPDAHQVVAMDLASGELRWQFTANGRIDTAPTLHKGLCLFGSKSGYVYCVRADNGQLVWRLRAAPVDERIVAYGQLESPWPVPGSVLVVGDTAYFAAGRQSLADGGILIFAVDYASGRPRWVQRLGNIPQSGYYDSSGLEFDNFDLLCLEDGRLAMSRWQFDCANGKMICDAKNGFAQIPTLGGSVWFPRGSWSYAPRNEAEQCKERPYLRPLAVFAGNGLYSCSQNRQSVFRRDFAPADPEKFNPEWYKGWDTYARARKGGELWQGDRLGKNSRWTVAPFSSPTNNQTIAAMALTRTALFVVSDQGRLMALDPVEGKPLAELQVPPIAWDALAAVEGRLVLSTQDGQVICLGAK